MNNQETEAAIQTSKHRSTFFLNSLCTAFILQDDLTGVIPNLSVGRPGMPGGKSAVDVHNPSQYDSIWHMLNYLVDEIQNEDMLNVSRRKNYTLHQRSANNRILCIDSALIILQTWSFCLVVSEFLCAESDIRDKFLSNNI
uniref:Uncharacterized protein n=1 Tax=Romanomermis culicivorax TaxID=13658 RepID=A0A915L773_ROMCU